jgi:membrane associated rhomboid family serine protease
MSLTGLDFTPVFLALALIAAFAGVDLWSLRHRQPDVFPGFAAWSRHFLPAAALALASVLLDPGVFAVGPRATTELLNLGAGYWPRTVMEPWRLITALGLQPSVQASVVNAFAVLVLGRALLATLGFAQLSFTFFLASVAGTLAAATANPQIISIGIAPAVAGLSGAAIALNVDPNLRPRMGAATFATIALHFGFFSLQSFHSFQQQEQGASPHALFAGLLTGATLAAAAVLLPVRTSLVRVSSATLMAALLGLWFSQLPRPIDRYAFIARAEAEIRVGSQRLVDLQELESEVAGPLRLLVDETDSLLSQDDAKHDPNLLAQKSNLEFRLLGLEVIRDVFAAREMILRAEEVEPQDPKLAEAHLNQFWSRALASLKKHREVIDNEILTTDDAKARSVLETLRGGLDEDVALLTETAVELEIKQTETWLMHLRANVLEGPGRAVASLKGDSRPDLAIRVDARLRRLVAVASRLPSRHERLEGLQSHLSHVRAAIH